MDTQLSSSAPAEPGNEPPEQDTDSQTKAADGDEPEAAGEPTPRRSIFISHKRDFDLDQNIADRLYDDLKGDFDIYLDTMQQPGVLYEDVIKEKIRNADYVLALMTENANRSEWVKAEIEFASRCRAQSDQGKPSIIPVHIDFSGDYDMRLAACLSGTHRIEWSSLADYEQLLKLVRFALDGSPPEIPSEVLGMEGFLVRDSRKRRMSAAFLDPLGATAAGAALKRAGDKLEAERLLWVVGDTGVRNYVALSLAIVRQPVGGDGAADVQKGGRVYEVTKSLSWSKVNKTMIRDSTIIFSNVMPTLFDPESPHDEFGSVERLIGRGNTVIVTASEESYFEIEQEMRKREFERKARLDVGRDFYDDDAKLRIFESLLKFSLDAGEISLRQHQLALCLREESPGAGGCEQVRGESRDLFLAILKKWSPADIERFITVHLRQVKKPGDLHKLLQRNADLEEEIHAWFVGLDDSTRCFVLSLAMLSGLGRAELWEKYKAVVQSLKKLDPGLSLWSLGICRERAGDYVTLDGPIDFIDEPIAEAICREIAKNFREYFVELLPLMRTWSVPSGRDQQRPSEAQNEERRQKIAQSKELRMTIARMVGVVGRHGLGDVTSLLDYWATDPVLAVRDASAVSLGQVAAEGAGAGQALRLLDLWAKDTSPGGDTLRRVYAAATALVNIVANRPGTSVNRRALAQLEALTKDTRKSIRFYISIPLKKAARKVALGDIEGVMNATAQDADASTRVNVAEALNESRLLEEAPALDLLAKWSASQDPNQPWTAACSQLLWLMQSRRSIDHRLGGVSDLLRQDAEATAGVLVELMGHRIYQKKAVHLFKRLVDGISEDTKKHLVDGLAALPFTVVDERVLSRLRASSKPEEEALVIGVRCENWRRQLATPVSFVNNFREALNHDKSREEALSTSLALLQPEPEGCRSGFRGALVTAFVQNRPVVGGLLEKLSTLAPSVFEPLSVEIRCAALRSLFVDPAAFVRAVSEEATRPKTAAQTLVALEVLAQPMPLGYYPELLRTLTDASATDAAALRTLLTLLRADGRAVFRQLARDVTQSLLEAEFTQPAVFLGRVRAAMADAGEREELLRILDALSDPGSHGKRKALVRVLSEAKVTHPLEVDELLQSQWPQTQSALSGLRLEVRLASLLNSSFTPKFMSKLFNSES
jgi:hypothetical protein